MAIIDVTKMWSKEGGTGRSDKYTAFAQQWSHTEGYQVVADVGTTTEQVLAASGVPDYSARHSSGADSFVRYKKATAVSPIFWIVEVSYEGELLNNTAVDVQWSDTTSTEPIDRDYDGNAIMTVNGEPVNGLTVEIADPVVVIKRKFLTVDTYAIGAYRHATNSDTFLGWPPGTARLIGYQANNQFSYGASQENWTVTARIQFRYPLMGATAAQAWYRRWRHEGLYVSSGGIIQRARDVRGQEVTKPVLLKANGEQETDPAAALFKYTQVYGSLPYSGLGLI